MTRLIVTAEATYEQRTAGNSNQGAALTEYRTVTVTAWNGTQSITGWALLDPEQGEPYVGDRWLLRPAHGKYTLTDTVNEIIGELS